ncbi:MAG: GrxA family glutaredoxin [Cellvibrionaceae bacterium]|nr:GrxA family glutaredoxin [Cellvibrionaceae bacterium]
MARFTIFGRPDCGYCVRSKQLLESKGYDFRWIDINAEGISKADLEQTVGKPVDTVPQVFHGQTHIGGFTELASYIQTLEVA